ncbi:MAG: hypothetical protein IJJ14_03550 [Coriobacteriales bacterium]|nr:hypothetical protein [Coriobacteriales bacterium]MBQ6586120.1 hypothetical protein [Coriobacteriales bacterium]
MKRPVIIAAIAAAVLALLISACGKEPVAPAPAPGAAPAPDAAPELTTSQVEPAFTDGWQRQTITQGGTSASFLLPPDWHCRVENVELYQDGSGPAQALISPSANAEGFIIISVGNGPVGVCGTGLTQTQVTFNGHPASMGVFNEHPYWDFIYLTGDMEGCNITNACGETWWNEYQPEITAILDSIEFSRTA